MDEIRTGGAIVVGRGHSRDVTRKATLAADQGALVRGGAPGGGAGGTAIVDGVLTNLGTLHVYGGAGGSGGVGGLGGVAVVNGTLDNAGTLALGGGRAGQSAGEGGCGRERYR